MTLASHWLHRLSTSREFRALIDTLKANTPAVCENAVGSSPAVMAGCIATQMQRPVLHVVAHLYEADDAIDDLERFGEAGMPLATDRFGALEVLPGETSVSLELLAERLGVVEKLATGEAGGGDGGSEMPWVIVAPVQALMQSVPRADAAARFAQTLVPGTQMSPGKLIGWLDAAGYQRRDAIEQPGDFAVRGGLVDVFPPAGLLKDGQGVELALTPLRVDFFGDEVDSLFAIDADSLASTHKLGEVRIVGASAEQVQSETDTTNLLELLPANAVATMHESMELAEQARGYYERLTNPVGIYAPKTIFAKLHAMPHVELNRYSPTRPDAERIALPAEALPPFDTDAKAAVAELAALARDASSDVRVLCRRPAERDRLIEMLQEEHFEASKKLRVEMGALHHGFVWGRGRGAEGPRGQGAE